MNKEHNNNAVKPVVFKVVQNQNRQKTKTKRKRPKGGVLIQAHCHLIFNNHLQIFPFSQEMFSDLSNYRYPESINIFQKIICLRASQPPILNLKTNWPFENSIYSLYPILEAVLQHWICAAKKISHASTKKEKMGQTNL